MLNAFIRKIKNEHGSKSGFINSCKYLALKQFGIFRHYERVDFSEVKRLVFICAGNICRSPLAEAAAIKEGFDAVSYGLLCRGGDKADPRAVLYANKIELNLQRHITQNIEKCEIKPGDLIIGMEPVHLEQAKAAMKMPNVQYTLAGLWLDERTPYIHDPYNTNDVFFDRCEEKIVLSARILAKKAITAKNTETNKKINHSTTN